MQRWLVLALLTVAGLPAQCVMSDDGEGGGVGCLHPAVRQDDFQRPDGAIGANWTNTLLSSSVLTISDGAVTNTDAAAEWVDAVWQADSYTDNQFSELLVRTQDAGGLGVK